MKREQNKAYKVLLQEIIQVVKQSQVYAVRSVQRATNLLYWEVGKMIIERQNQYGWGASVVEKLSIDLQDQIGAGQSWSARNLRMMKQLYEEYTLLINNDFTNVKQVVSHLNYTNVKQPVSHLPKRNAKKVNANIDQLKQLIAEVPWGQNILILQKVKELKARIFYLHATIQNGWSRAVLLYQIKADAYAHFIAHPKQHNFSLALPEHMVEQARESIKSVYSLEFLQINKPLAERELEQKLVENVKRFLLELGYGFCFIGNQYRLALGRKEYFIDLLFYHRILKCLVAVDLKVVEFEPQFVGKLDYYLHLVDEQLKQKDDNPSIGILLVPDKDHLEVEYALKIASKPIGVAEYTITKELPKNIKGYLPTKAEWAKMLKM